ncbi:hypothetical protein B296_00028469 [Ensete ventricosum]|uniref:cellulase n=1 Tax=Ensete ventricosum TaxID=4639 RepID=A0A427ADJ0_ENSVE|nr:hypothetical protein B296_00028469 [Ensete ventricosum]
MAFTGTMLAWSIIEFSAELGPELVHAHEALRWLTDYLLKATAQPNRIFVQVGDPYSDHNCWERPDDMDTPRPVYQVNQTHPGSEVAGETAAALAAASVVFRSSDPAYAVTLLSTISVTQTRVRTIVLAMRCAPSTVITMAIRLAIPKDLVVNSLSFGDLTLSTLLGSQDELVWGAAWLNRATTSSQYQSHIVHGIKQMELEENASDLEFGWDAKNAGNYLLLFLQHKRYKSMRMFSVNKAMTQHPTLASEPPRGIDITDTDMFIDHSVRGLTVFTVDMTDNGQAHSTATC